MANSSLNGFPVIEGRILRPRVGNWVAELVLDAQVESQLPNGSPASLLTDGGALSFSGTILRGADYAQTVSVRVVGGKNGLGLPTRPRFYAGVELQQPLEDALGDGGERLSGSSDPGALATSFGFWTMVQQPVAQALTLLANKVGVACVWRVLSDGSVRFGTDGFPPTALSEFELISYLPQEKLQELSSEDPVINPGESFNGFHVSSVEHLLSSDSSRVRLLFE